MGTQYTLGDTDKEMYQKLVKISGVAMPRSVIGEENSHRALN